MKSAVYLTLTLIFSFVLAASLSAQDSPQNRGKSKAHKRGGKAPILVPAGEAKTDSKPKAAPTDQAAPTPTAPPSRSLGPQEMNRMGQGGANSNLDPDPKQPRPTLPRSTKPYSSNRAILEVNGVSISSSDLNRFAVYYQGFRQNVVDLHLRAAVNALLPLTVMKAKYADDLPAMKQRIDEAVQAIEDGQEWADVVAKYSDDNEAENPDGSYSMGRERAVQPFDFHSHSGKLNKLVGPFLTVYGYHVLEITKYDRGGQAKDDVSTVRHMLVMYPQLKKMDEEGVDIRKFIKEQVKAAKVVALEAASANLVPIH